MYTVVVYTPSERADTLPLFLLYPYVYLTPAAVTKKDADKNS
jgi:hypothetical protein